MPTLSKRFDEALELAHNLHRRQVRKGSGTPYIAHLLGVAALVLEFGGDEDEAIAALLHDAVEDQGGAATVTLIRMLFGKRIIDIVLGCSDSTVQPKPPWRKRKEAYLAHLPATSPSIRLVSCADKLYNAEAVLRDYQEVGEALWERFRGGRDGTLWYYRALADAFLAAGPERLARELEATVRELERRAAG